MAQLTIITFYLGVVCYSVASTLYLLELGYRQLTMANRWGPRVLAAAAVFHAGHICTASLLTNTCPVHAIQFMLSAGAWISAVLYLLLRSRARWHAVGVLIAPLGLAFMVSAQHVGSIQHEEVPSSLLAVHITANLLGLGLFLLAGAAGAFYLVQERRLKNKRLRLGAGKLPPLDSLDLAEYRLLLGGFLLLTLGIVTGVTFHVPDTTTAQFARAMIAYATWGLVAAVLTLRVLAGWRGRRAAYGTLAGVAGVVAVIVLYVVRASTGA